MDEEALEKHKSQRASPTATLISSLLSMWASFLPHYLPELAQFSITDLPGVAARLCEKLVYNWFYEISQEYSPSNDARLEKQTRNDAGCVLGWISGVTSVSEPEGVLTETGHDEA